MVAFKSIVLRIFLCVLNIRWIDDTSSDIYMVHIKELMMMFFMMLLIMFFMLFLMMFLIIF